MPAIEFTDYARLQMLERELSEELVREALMEPDEIVAGDRGRRVAHERLGPDSVIIYSGWCLKSGRPVARNNGVHHIQD